VLVVASPAVAQQAAGGTAAAGAQVSEGGSGGGGGRRGERGRWLDELGVSAEQRAKIAEIKQKKRADTESRREELKRLHEELKGIMAGDGPAEKARAVHERMQTVQRELGDVNFESMLAVRELLTPEQRARFVETMQLRKSLGFGPKR
jgi:Spy/CpxP family protein refolding chaperone